MKYIIGIISTMLCISLVGCGAKSDVTLPVTEDRTATETSSVSTESTLSSVESSTLESTSSLESDIPEEAMKILSDLKAKIPEDLPIRIEYDKAMTDYPNVTYYDFYEYYDDIKIDQCIRYSNPPTLVDHSDGYVFGDIIIDNIDNKNDIKFSTEDILEKYSQNAKYKDMTYVETIYVYDKDKTTHLTYHYSIGSFEHLYVSPITGEIVGSRSDVIID